MDMCYFVAIEQITYLQSFTDPALAPIQSHNASGAAKVVAHFRRIVRFLFIVVTMRLM